MGRAIIKVFKTKEEAIAYIPIFLKKEPTLTEDDVAIYYEPDMDKEFPWSFNWL